jgi:putative acetyltransferase
MVFFAAIREGPSPYSERQRAAWCAQPPEPDAFAARLAPQHVVLAADTARVMGFMSLEKDYIDLAFILPSCRGRGVFRTLFTAIEAKARARGETRLWTHASLMAQPAFRAMGFEVMHHETVEIEGEYLARARMEKTLA